MALDAVVDALTGGELRRARQTGALTTFDADRGGAAPATAYDRPRNFPVSAIGERIPPISGAKMGISTIDPLEIALNSVDDAISPQYFNIWDILARVGLPCVGAGLIGMDSEARLRELLDAARRERLRRRREAWTAHFGGAADQQERQRGRREAWNAYFSAIGEDDAVKKVAARLATVRRPPIRKDDAS